MRFEAYLEGLRIVKLKNWMRSIRRTRDIRENQSKQSP